MRRNYRRDKAAGICVKCRKQAAQDTNVRCVDCQAKHYAQKQRARARARSAKAIVR